MSVKASRSVSIIHELEQLAGGRKLTSITCKSCRRFFETDHSWIE
jgi:hypothetical protein